MDRPEPTLLWDIDADTTVPLPLRNNDWDGAALIVGDYLLEGGENGWLYVVHLNRGYDEQGLVTVDPEIVATIAGFDDELLGDLGDREVSIENSVAFRKGVVYFANSGGLVQGWDISDLLGGRHRLQPGVPVLGRATTSMPRSCWTRRGSSTWRPSTSGSTSAPRRSASS